MANRPRASFKDLKARWGRLRVTEGTELEPRILELRSDTTGFEVWRWIAGSGAKALFERISPWEG